MTSFFKEEKDKTQNQLDDNSLMSFPKGESKALRQIF